jgi:hypothetical protein
MTNADQTKSQDELSKVAALQRTKQVETAGWTAGLTAFFALGTVTTNPSWPVSTAAIGVSVAVAFVCYQMLK